MVVSPGLYHQGKSPIHRPQHSSQINFSRFFVRLGVVLGSVGLGWLHTPLVEAGVRSLARLRSLSVEQLLSKLEGTCRQRAAIGPVRQKLGCLGLQRPSGDAPLPPQGMMRD